MPRKARPSTLTTFRCLQRNDERLTYLMSATGLDKSKILNMLLSQALNSLKKRMPNMPE